MTQVVHRLLETTCPRVSLCVIFEYTHDGSMVHATLRFREMKCMVGWCQLEWSPEKLAWNRPICELILSAESGNSFWPRRRSQTPTKPIFFWNVRTYSVSILRFGASSYPKPGVLLGWKNVTCESRIDYQAILDQNGKRFFEWKEKHKVSTTYTFWVRESMLCVNI